MLLISIINKEMFKRQTRQKEILKLEVDRQKSFFTAEELHENAKKRDDKIGIATIYRFLKELKTNKELHPYLCNRKTIYSTSEKNHCHFSCQQCGKVMHINIGSVDFLKKNFKGEICHFQVNVEGICDDCRI